MKRLFWDFNSIFNILVFVILLGLISCRAPKPVFFKSADAVFDISLNTVNFRAVYYDDLYGVKRSEKALKQTEAIDIKIQGPTFFSTRFGDAFLVYPKEKIDIIVNKDGEFDLKISGNSKRSLELSLLKEVRLLFKKPVFAVQFDSIYKDDIVRRLKTYLDYCLQYSSEKISFYDSLASIYKVQKRNREITKLYLATEPYNRLIGYCQQNEKLWTERGVQKNVCKQLLGYANAITDIKQIQYGMSHFVSDIADYVLPQTLWNIRNEDVFRQLFDSSVVLFNGVSRDFVLTKILDQAYYRKIAIPKEYLSKYNSICKTPEYKTVARQLHLLAADNDNTLKSFGFDALQTIQGDKTNIEELIAAHKGEVILLDFWATWCGPCLQHIPHLDSLTRLFAQKDFVIISLSLDRNILNWQNFVIQRNREEKSSYVFVDPGKSVFLKRYNIDAIPRYILIDKQGNVVADNAPSPDGIELASTIERLFLNP